MMKKREPGRGQSGQPEKVPPAKTAQRTETSGNELMSHAVQQHRVAAPTAEERHERIARAAYYRAEQRGFAPGGELQDWLAAESEVDLQLD